MPTMKVFSVCVVVLCLSQSLCEAQSTTSITPSTSTPSMAPTSTPSMASTTPATGPSPLPTSAPTNSPTTYFMTPIPSQTEAICPESDQHIETIEGCWQASEQVNHPVTGEALSLEKCFTTPKVLLTYLATVVGPSINACDGVCTANSSSLECEQCVIDYNEPERYPYGCYWKEQTSYPSQYDNCSSVGAGYRLWFNPLGTVEKSDIKVRNTYMAICNKGPPTQSPTTNPPTAHPTSSPPTEAPTHSPTTPYPTHSPTPHPTLSPTLSPTSIPTAPPTISPAHLPTQSPAEEAVVEASSNTNSVPQIVIPVTVALVAVFVVALIIVVCVCRRLRHQDQFRQAKEEQGTAVQDITERYHTLTAVALASTRCVHRDVDDIIRCALRMNSELANLGLTFGGALTREEGLEKGMGVFIHAVQPGSEASRHPELRPGLQITRAQGHDLQSIIVPDFEKILAVHQNRTLLHFELMENTKLYEAYAGVAFSRQQSMMRISAFANISPQSSQQGTDTGFSRNTSFSALDEHHNDVEYSDNNNDNNNFSETDTQDGDHRNSDGTIINTTSTNITSTNRTATSRTVNFAAVNTDVVDKHEGLRLSSSVGKTYINEYVPRDTSPPPPSDLADDSSMSNRNSSFTIPTTVTGPVHRSSSSASSSSSPSLTHLAHTRSSTSSSSPLTHFTHLANTVPRVSTFSMVSESDI